MQIFLFIVLGFFSLISQALVIRELLNAFYGNDLFINLALGSWLFWTGVGCLLGRNVRHTSSSSAKPPLLAASYILAGILLPLQIFCIRFVSSRLGMSGEIPNLLAACLISFLLVCPICLLVGAQFSLAIKHFFHDKNNGINLFFVINRAYFYELCGFIIGGVVFSFVFIFCNEFWVACVLGTLNLLVALTLYSKKNGSKRVFFLCAVFILSGVILTTNSQFLDLFNRSTKQLKFGNQTLIRSINTVYGNISVTRLGKQHNFFETGALIGTEEDTVASEKLIHLPLTFHENPKNILIIGTAFNGALRELLKYNPDSVSYIELDPEIYRIVPHYLPADLRAALDNKRILKIHSDPRNFFRQCSEHYDAVIINLPTPSSMLINRCFTEEFFRQIKSHLAQDGLIALFVVYAPSYANQPLKMLNGSVYKTLRQVFTNSLILPDDQNLMLGFQSSAPLLNSSQLATRFGERKISCKFFNEKYLAYRLSRGRLDETAAKLNKDLSPSAYYYSVLFFISTFYPHLAYWLGKLFTIHVAWFILFLLALFSFLRFKKEREKSDSDFHLVAAMAIAGFSLMSIQGILILAFQVFFGNLYFRLTLLMTCVVAGMALGAGLGLFKDGFIYNKFGLKNFFFLNAFYSLVALWLLFFETKSEFVLYGLAAVIGFLVGAEFDLINQTYFLGSNKERNPGAIYSADLLGSCLGLFLTSFFLVPALGIPLALFILGLINFLMAELLYRKT